MLAGSHSTFHSNRRLRRVLRWAVRRGERVILVFGEIDCRIHIYNAYMKNEKRRDFSDLIGEAIARYGGVLDSVKDAGVEVYAYSVPPAGEAENIFGYSHFASIENRAEIVRTFNAMLGDYCVEHEINFIDVYSRVADGNGLMAAAYAGDEVHLNSRAVEFVLEDLQAT